MLHEGQQIGGYTLILKLGKGGFGEVWLAERRTELVTTQVALKFSLTENIDLQTIKNEALVWSKASGHPNVLPIIEANIYDGHVVIVSEFAPDGSLEELLNKHQFLPVGKIVELTMGILSGLQFLHSKQIIHRDIKPANVLLQGETPRLTDFGVSRLSQNNTSVSQTVAGTPKYMSPETFDGKRNAQTDIWSVGVMLYQMLSGQLPFPQEETTELIGAIVLKEPSPLPEFVPQPLKNIVGRALSKNPTERYQSADQMRQDLFQILTRNINTANAPTSQTEATLRQTFPVPSPPAETQPILLNQPTQPTVLQTAQSPKTSKLSMILAGVAALILLLIGVIGGGIYYVVKTETIFRTPPPTSPPYYPPPTPPSTPKVVIDYQSNETIQKTIAAVEEKAGGEFKFVSLHISQNGIMIKIQDPKNPENYDSYSYHDGKLDKSPDKMDASAKRRNRPFVKGDINWAAIPSLVKTAKEKLAGFEGVEEARISVSHWLDVDRDLLISVYISSPRKNLTLNANSQGQIKRIKLE